MAEQYLTKEGLEKLKKELVELKTVKRREIAQRLEKSLAYGDLSENAEYQEAKQAQEDLESRIFKLENLLKEAVIISSRKSSSEVEVGSTILVSHQGVKEKYRIVGPLEADPLEGRISLESPLGKAFLNQAEGSEVEVETPKGKKKYKITKIE